MATDLEQTAWTVYKHGGLWDPCSYKHVSTLATDVGQLPYKWYSVHRHVSTINYFTTIDITSKPNMLHVQS